MAASPWGRQRGVKRRGGGAGGRGDGREGGGAATGAGFLDTLPPLRSPPSPPSWALQMQGETGEATGRKMKTLEDSLLLQYCVGKVNVNRRFII